MKTKRCRTLFLSSLGVAMALVMALGMGTWGLLGSSTQAQVSPVDLTGETCLSGTATIDPDGAGPLPSFTYCVMNGNIGSKALEMDDIDGLPPVSGSPNSVADANLYSGGTSNDPDLPAVAGATYIDWADLSIMPLTGPGAAPLGSVENHRILDWTANSDFTMLKPQASSCLNDGSVLPKEDFTESYIANNNNFLYFAQERRTNNGNSVYYWLITHKPVIVVSNSDCGSGTRGQIQFNLSANDVELLVNFPDSSDPASGGVFFRSYSGPDSGYIPARDAVFNAGWGPVGTAPIHNLAINIAEAPHAGDDSFGPWGGIDSHGNPVATGSFTTASFAEWAVDLISLFGGQPLCGQQLFITGMSRASTGQIGALTEPAALKDVIGPKLYSFGAITASASLTPSCNLSFGYTASAVGIDGVTPIPPADLSASWTCTDPDGHTVTLTDALALSGTGTVPRDGGAPHTINCTVTVTDTASQCTDDANASTTVFAPILVNITPNATSLSCTVPGSPGSDNGNIGPGVTFSPTVSGGNGSYTYEWHVSGPSVATCASAATCVVDIPDQDFCALTTVSVAVDDVGNSLCPAASSETEEVTKITTVNATNH